jgi:hypothetical protein
MRSKSRAPEEIPYDNPRFAPAAELTTSWMVDVRLAHIKKAGALIYINAMRRTGSQFRQ